VHILVHSLLREAVIFGLRGNCIRNAHQRECLVAPVGLLLHLVLHLLQLQLSHAPEQLLVDVDRNLDDDPRQLLPLVRCQLDQLLLVPIHRLHCLPRLLVHANCGQELHVIGAHIGRCLRKLEQLLLGSRPKVLTSLPRLLLLLLLLILLLLGIRARSCLLCSLVLLPLLVLHLHIAIGVSLPSLAEASPIHLLRNSPLCVLLRAHRLHRARVVGRLLILICLLKAELRAILLLRKVVPLDQAMVLQRLVDAIHHLHGLPCGQLALLILLYLLLVHRAQSTCVLASPLAHITLKLSIVLGNKFILLGDCRLQLQDSLVLLLGASLQFIVCRIRD